VPSDRPPAHRVALALLATVLAACTTGPDEPRNPTPGTIAIPTALRVGIAEPLSIDPARVDSAGGLLVVSHLFDGLVDADPRGRSPAPAAAASWDVQEDGRVIEFTLRPGAEFHDGTPVTAGDFAFAWTRLADPETHSPYAFLLEAVAGYREFHILREATALAGVEAVDPRTFRVTLVRPWPGFVALAAHPALSPVPPAASGADFDAEPVGNGPYRIAEPWNLGQPILLERAEVAAGRLPPIHRLEFEVYDTAEEAWPDFLAGDLDIASVPPTLIPEAETRFGESGFVTLARLLYCGFNLAREPFEEARLRRAVSLAVDREALAGGVYGALGEPAPAIVPPSLRGHDPNACGGNCEPDVVEAARLVSGLPADHRAFRLQVIASDVGEQLGETLAGQLNRVGLDVTPQLLDEEAFGARLQTGTQEAFCLVWDADSATQQGMLEPLLMRGSPDNHSRLRNQRIDTALADARAASTAAAQVAAYQRVERIALQILPLVPIVWFRSHVVAQPYVRGFRVDPLGMFDASEMELEPEVPAPTAGPSLTP
jgi:ABC-type oligopeptide transport system substrate-binding subunit